MTFIPRTRDLWSLGGYDTPDVQFGGLDDTTGVEWILEDPQGWSTTTTEVALEASGGDGGFFGAARIPSKPITLRGGFRACSTDALDDAEDQLRDALERYLTDQLLWKAGVIPKGMWLRLSGDLTVDTHRKQPIRTFTAVMMAADPYKYEVGANALRSVSMVLQAPVGTGLEFPAALPADFGGNLPVLSRGIINNPGRAPSPALITLTGPTPTNAGVLLVETGEFFRVAPALAVNSTAIIDTAAGTLTIDGVSRLNARTPGSTFWSVPARSSNVQFVADAYDPAAKATVFYQARWR